MKTLQELNDERDTLRITYNILVQVSLIRSLREFEKLEVISNKWLCTIELILPKNSFTRDYNYLGEKTIYFDTYEECLEDGIRLANKIINNKTK